MSILFPQKQSFSILCISVLTLLHLYTANVDAACSHALTAHWWAPFWLWKTQKIGRACAAAGMSPPALWTVMAGDGCVSISSANTRTHAAPQADIALFVSEAATWTQPRTTSHLLKRVQHSVFWFVRQGVQVLAMSVWNKQMICFDWVRRWGIVFGIWGIWANWFCKRPTYRNETWAHWR